MIISASRRTDIPAFFGAWMSERLRAGEVLVRNPVRPKQVSRIGLRPEDVDALVFWTKHAAPFFPRLAGIAAMGYRFYVLYTLTPYGRLLEPEVCSLEERIEAFRQLSRLIGSERVLWRYDPVILAEGMDLQWHAEAFDLLARRLAGFTRRCIFSFLDDYRTIRRRMQSVRYVMADTGFMNALVARFACSAERYGLSLYACCEDTDFSGFGVMRGCCIDADLIERIGGRKPLSVRKDRSQRPHCGCVQSRDIGSYDTCRHGCRYCYAVSAGRTPRAVYDPHAPMLCDRLSGDETIVSAGVTDCR